MAALFTQTTLTGDFGITTPTALQWGPDGKLYVTSRFGDISVVTVERSDSGTYSVVSREIISAVREMPNHDDDGSLAGPDDDGFAHFGVADVDTLAANQRQVTGILVGGTAENPVIYVSSSDPRSAGESSGADGGLDTNSGVVSRLTRNADGDWEKVDLVRGLPRAETNHSINGLAFSPDGTKLLLAVGSNTNAGAPSNYFAGLPETALSGAMLEIDIAAIDAMPLKTYSVPGFAPQHYLYDLPTLDDPTRPNGANGADLPGSGLIGGDPFGGNDGLNQAKLIAGGPVRIFSPGYRNPYDVLVTEDGRIWTYDNSANRTMGGPPLDQNGNQYTGAPGQIATNLPNEANFGLQFNYNQLHEVTDGFYAGHPNLVRAFGEQAGWLYTPNDGTTGARLLEPDELPVDFASVVQRKLRDPREALYLEGGFADGALDTARGSVNGLAEYTASALVPDGNGGFASLKGALLATNYGPDSLYIIPRNPDGSVATTTIDGRTVAVDRQEISLGGGGPLGIDAIGDDGPFPGTIWIGRLNNGTIVILEPSTDPTPPNEDLDGDGLDNFVDHFALDPTNGLGTVIQAGTTRVYDFEPGTGEFPGTEGGIGFTGAMVNGTEAYRTGTLVDFSNLILGGAPGLLSIKNVGRGHAQEGLNTQHDALQLGVTLDPSVRTVSFTTTMSNWIIDAGQNVPLDGVPSAGFFIGTGDQDNYFKLVVGGREKDGTPRAFLAQLFESAGVIQEGSGSSDPSRQFDESRLLAQADPADNVSWIQLRITIDTAAGTITPLWRFGTDAERGVGEAAKPFVAGNSFAASGDLLAAIDGSYQVDGHDSGLAVGVIGTSKGGTPFTVNYDDLVIAAPGNGSATFKATAGATDLANASTSARNSFLLENTSTDGLTITKVEIAMAEAGAGGAYHSILPGIVFDPASDATAVGGDAAKDFTRNSGSVGAFGVTASVSGPDGGGYKLLTLDLTGFDPGEKLAFSIDQDPLSIQGAASKSAVRGAAAISGAEQIGVPVTITFSDGSTQTAELFSDGSLAGAEAVLRPGLAAAPTLSIAGDPATEKAVTALEQSVTITGGIPGGQARIVVMEGGAYPMLDPPNGHVFGPFEANKALALHTQIVTLDASGSWTGTVSLTDGPDSIDGINYLVAAMVDAAGTVAGLVSNRIAFAVQQPVAAATAGDDALTGTAGTDVIDGLAGNDTIRGGDGRDSLLGGDGNDVLLGGRGANLLHGGAGDDVLSGGAGPDTLWGGLGSDTLEGGKGADLFRYGSAAEGGDVILDYVGADDQIEVSAAGFGGGLTAGMDLVAAGRYVANTSGTATSPSGVGQFVFETDTNLLRWDADGSGGAAGIVIANLTGATGWAGSEIAVIA